jgi:TonB family protein
MSLLPVLASALLAATPPQRADESVARPRPDNKPCPYPPKAQKAFVAGPVSFKVEVDPDGSVASVDVVTVPQADLGFEEAVSHCLSQWRFEPASAGGPRRHEGRIAFRLDPAKESAMRGVLEALAAAWNAGDNDAVQELSLQSDDPPGKEPVRGYLHEQIQAGRTDRWRMELGPTIERIEFLGPELATVRQPYRRVPLPLPEAGSASGEEHTLAAIMAAGTRGWRILSAAPSATEGPEVIRVESGRIREPKKVKDVRPIYPDIAKQARLQGVVVLECLIAPDGKVRFARVLRGGAPVLDVAALQAVRQWEYTPTLLDGRPVPVFMTVTVNFRLS